MTQDEIIEMARQASFTENSEFKGCFVCNPLSLEYFAKLVAEKEREQLTDAAMKAAEKAVDSAIALEREACAKVCDARYMGDNSREDMETKRCAKAIRARGET